ncbi:MAG: DNA-directed RNA polymerase subunit alpha [Candidatus Komeilibacteria bacterium CG_4_10_14_0_2_um_filter_37_10]|uniref:DNA-directed RNA polymerase subunit alpha n=1 Tax=Candidatus Komeilibacteria bacterium CG_4_10_14_0_2_um_filter_37_10 TaxID=1974470 RepID=A0A2M7VE94_9BACT|nr:MAG: DNA-directed RNA polymerase subunit alpha [Candidatus Komeilibacteria bacterium CG_4_10_14_0_2_um_filter_37_10]
MFNITPPDKINFKKISDNKAEVIIEPCYPGFGVTIGNSLRRVLLSSLDGAAVVGFKIVGVDHEFNSIPFVKEDVVDIILNLKKVRVKIYADVDEEIKLNLVATGEKVVTAADISKNSDVEIVSGDQPIATLTDKNVKLDMEIIVKKGRGYVMVERRDKEKLEIGTIAIDALYSPVVNVAFKIENTRVGEMTNYEKLILEIQTDGSITPKSAIQSAVNILVNEFEYLLNLDDAISKKSVSKDSKQEEVNEQPDEEIAEKVEELADKKEKKRGRPKKNDK